MKFESVFSVAESVRYVAIYHDGTLYSAQRPGVKDASSSESDKYEELFVNPAILMLATQRGKLDCGGLDHVLIRYGSFFQMVLSFPSGHASICIDKDENPLTLLDRLRSELLVCLSSV